MIVLTLILLALVSPFFFPVFFSLGITTVVAYLFPPITFFVGVLFDVLYLTPSVGFPFASLIGLVSMLVFYVVRRVVKARIIDA